MKSATTLILLVFVAASVVYLVVGGSGGAEGVTAEAIRPGPSPTATTGVPVEGAGMEPVATKPPAAETAEAETDGRHVVVYYFHRTQRCRTCLAMQAYTQQALEEGLEDVLESGALEWREVNVDQPGNEHFVNEYDLYASALVMVEEEGGRVLRSKKLEQIWQLARDEWKFKEFVRDEALAYLEDAP